MLDGTVELEPDGDATLALSLALGGITARTEARITGCKVGCVYDAGSTIEVDGIGVTEASGTFAVQDMPTATAVHLRASDELSITHDGDCFVYAGAAGGRVCSEK